MIEYEFSTAVLAGIPGRITGPANLHGVSGRGSEQLYFNGGKCSHLPVDKKLLLSST